MTALIVTLLLSQTPAESCRSIGISDAIVACMGIISSHQVQPEAARTCRSIGITDAIVDCMRAASDKTYSAEELSSCRSIGITDKIVQCIQVTGRSNAPARQEPPPRRGSRYDDDDDEDDTWIMRVTNYNRTPVRRIYWRGRGERFVDARLPSDLGYGLQTEVTINRRKIDVCVESPDGYRLLWNKVRRGDALEIAPNEPNWSRGRCRDL